MTESPYVSDSWLLAKEPPVERRRVMVSSIVVGALVAGIVALCGRLLSAAGRLLLDRGEPLPLPEAVLKLPLGAWLGVAAGALALLVAKDRLLSPRLARKLNLAALAVALFLLISVTQTVLEEIQALVG